MMRILVAIVVALLLTDYSWSQSNCEQIRQAIATYGYAAARQHALTHYGPDALKEGDKCGLTEAAPAAPHHPKHKPKPPKKHK
jgi:hypothetical protein